jgi:hypothetical protein
MRKTAQFYIGQGCAGTTVLRVAFATIKHSLLFEKNAVEFVRVGQFNLDICMTAHTTILYSISFPGRCVALLAIVADLSMRADIPKHSASLNT